MCEWYLHECGEMWSVLRVHILMLEFSGDEERCSECESENEAR